MAQCKKGREAQQKNINFQTGQATNASNQSSYFNDILKQLLGGEISSTTPGSMSPDAAAMYASDMDKINNTYNGLRQNAFASSARRGFGGAPSGFQQSAENAINQGEGTAATAAYRSGIENTEQQRQNAMQTALGGTSAWNANELGNTGQASNSAYELNHMGSTLGDVLSGASSVIGGMTGLSNLMGSWGKLFGGGSGPSYMPNDTIGQPTGNLPNPSVPTYTPTLPRSSSIGPY